MFLDSSPVTTNEAISKLLHFLINSCIHDCEATEATKWAWNAAPPAATSFGNAQHNL